MPAATDLPRTARYALTHIHTHTHTHTHRRPRLILRGLGLCLHTQQMIKSAHVTACVCVCVCVCASLFAAALAVGVVGGKRLPVTGFLIEASKLLHSLVHTGYDSGSDSRGEDPHLEHIRLALAANNQWSEYTDPEAGAYAKLLKELEGDLGGPRAMRSANTLEGSELVELTGGGLLTGPELLAMLQGMSLPSS